MNKSSEDTSHPLWMKFVDWMILKSGHTADLGYRGTRQKWEAFKAGADAERELCSNKESGE